MIFVGTLIKTDHPRAATLHKLIDIKTKHNPYIVLKKIQENYVQMHDTPQITFLGRFVLER